MAGGGTNHTLVSPLPVFRLLLVFVFVPGLESLEGRLLCAHSFPISAREQLQPLNNWQENTQDSTRSSTNRPNQSGEKGEEQEQVKKKQMENRGGLLEARVMRLSLISYESRCSTNCHSNSSILCHVSTRRWRCFC